MYTWLYDEWENKTSEARRDRTNPLSEVLFRKKETTKKTSEQSKKFGRVEPPRAHVKLPLF